MCGRSLTQVRAPGTVYIGHTDLGVRSARVGRGGGVGGSHEAGPEHVLDKVEDLRVHRHIPTVSNLQTFCGQKRGKNRTSFQEWSDASSIRLESLNVKNARGNPRELGG